MWSWFSQANTNKAAALLKKKNLLGGWDVGRGGEEEVVNSTRGGGIRKDFTEESWKTVLIRQAVEEDTIWTKMPRNAALPQRGPASQGCEAVSIYVYSAAALPAGGGGGGGGGGRVLFL